MNKIIDFPGKCLGLSAAGITIHLGQSENRAVPFELTLFFKKPGNEDTTLDPDDDNNISGKLTVRLGKK